MFENFSLLLLQQYWWIIVSLLGALLVFLMFVQGGQTLIYSLGKTESERSLLVNVLGHKWEYTFTTLVTFGGAFFASFPLFYSTSFGGAYWVWIIILFAFVLQAVSYEFRSKAGNIFGHKVYEVFLFLNGALGTILIGAAVSTFFTGSEFIVDKARLTQTPMMEAGEAVLPIISSWQTPTRGLEAALNIQNLALGLSVFMLARILGMMYFMRHIDDDTIFVRAKKQLRWCSIAFLVVFLFFVIRLMFLDGFEVMETGKVVMTPHKYFYNLLEMPLNTAIFLIGIVGVLLGIGRSLFKEKATDGIWYAGIGTVLTVFALFLLAGFNNTAYYPSTADLQSSLTIQNSSSSHYTLTAMSYVSLMIPFVLAYIVYAWRSIARKKVSADSLKDEFHTY